MLRVWGAASGEEMAALPVEEVETAPWTLDSTARVSGSRLIEFSYVDRSVCMYM